MSKKQEITALMRKQKDLYEKINKVKELSLRMYLCHGTEDSFCINENPASTTVILPAGEQIEDRYRNLMRAAEKVKAIE